MTESQTLNTQKEKHFDKTFAKSSQGHIEPINLCQLSMIWHFLISTKIQPQPQHCQRPIYCEFGFASYTNEIATNHEIWWKNYKLEHSDSIKCGTRHAISQCFQFQTTPRVAVATSELHHCNTKHRTQFKALPKQSTKRQIPFCPWGRPWTCSLVLITSNGHTNVAAIVPAQCNCIVNPSILNVTLSNKPFWKRLA